MKTKVTDISATGTPGPTTFLAGDGSWSTPAGGGGGGGGSVVGNYFKGMTGNLEEAISSSAYATKGIVFRPDVDLQIDHVHTMLDAVSTANSFHAEIWSVASITIADDRSLPSALTVGSKLGESTPMAIGNNAKIVFDLSLTATVDVSAGGYYLIVIVWDNAPSGTSILPVGAKAANLVEMNAPGLTVYGAISFNTVGLSGGQTATAITGGNFLIWMSGYASGTLIAGMSGYASGTLIAGGGAPWEVVNSWDFSVDGALASRVVDLQDYTDVVIIGDQVTASGTLWRGGRLSLDGGATYLVQGVDNISDSGGLTTTGDGGIFFHSTSTSAARSWRFKIQSLNLPNVSKWVDSNRTNTVGIFGRAGNSTQDPVTHIRIGPVDINGVPSGTFTGGRFVVLGRPKKVIAGSTDYVVPFGFTSPPITNELLLIHSFTRGVTFNTNMSGFSAHVGVNPTASFSMDVQKNGVSIATISVTTSGVVTVTSSSVSFSAGDVLTVKAPTTVDATIGNMAFSFMGIRI